MNKSNDDLTCTKPVIDRMDRPPQYRDTQNIKEGFYRWILSKSKDVFSLQMTVGLLKKLLPYIQCLDANFTCVQDEDIKSNLAFWKGMYNIVDGQLKDRHLLRTKCLEVQRDLLLDTYNMKNQHDSQEQTKPDSQETKPDSQEQPKPEDNQIDSTTKNDN